MLKQCSSSVYLCEDPADKHTYEFPVSRLRRYRSEMTSDAAAVIALDTEEYVVDCIIDHNFPSRNKSDWDFKVRWKDLPSPEEDSWIPWREAKKLKQLDEYRNLHPELKIPSS